MYSRRRRSIKLALQKRRMWSNASEGQGKNGQAVYGRPVEVCQRINDIINMARVKGQKIRLRKRWKDSVEGLLQ